MSSKIHWYLYPILNLESHVYLPTWGSSWDGKRSPLGQVTYHPGMGGVTWESRDTWTWGGGGERYAAGLPSQDIPAMEGVTWGVKLVSTWTCPSVSGKGVRTYYPDILWINKELIRGALTSNSFNNIWIEHIPALPLCTEGSSHLIFCKKDVHEV